MYSNQSQEIITRTSRKFNVRKCIDRRSPVAQRVKDPALSLQWLGCCCSAGLTPDLRTSTCLRWGKKKKENVLTFRGSSTKNEHKAWLINTLDFFFLRVLNQRPAKHWAFNFSACEIENFNFTACWHTSPGKKRHYMQNLLTLISSRIETITNSNSKSTFEIILLRTYVQSVTTGDFF